MIKKNCVGGKSSILVMSQSFFSNSLPTTELVIGSHTAGSGNMEHKCVVCDKRFRQKSLKFHSMIHREVGVQFPAQIGGLLIFKN